MNDEIKMIARERPDAPPYSLPARAAARRRLTGDGPGGHGFARDLLRTVSRRPYGMAIGGVALTSAAAVAVMTVVPHGVPADPVSVAQAPSAQTPSDRVPSTHGGSDPGQGPEVVVALPKIAKVSAEEVLGRAARAATDLNPRGDQFIKVSSQTMYGAFGGGETNVDTGEVIPETRYLYRTKRTIWLSADGTRDGSLKVENLTPRAYPGWPIPEEANREKGTWWASLPVCDGAPRDTAYTSLKKLPTDAKGMRDYLYSREHGDNPPDTGAWAAAGDLLRETYMPAAQRAALFEAAATIPGVTVTEDAQDAAGRRGIGVGRVSFGVREDIIFDPETYELLGERGVVVDAKKAKSPVGSLVASTAQLEVTVADSAPEVDDPASRCMNGG
ncbi:CU044_5270 family protein [Sphaerimonospora thailandensis]|uniref:CU044_5270 family protein n=1 Tax=Sphaerimonospora thailandensis TaxID=795644 RepID=A0A8J3VY82_9ACTN|nr:CU044_5270 family protein [Sphaerimonospora thailandensis]GIH68671.1 hypothetical protein Mth01_09240 [Sphaerimonospora thailandensis]